MNASSYDFKVFADESIAIVTPVTDRARGWFLEHTEGELLPFGDGYAVELRYVGDLCNGILDEGLTVTKDGMTMIRSALGDLVLEPVTSV